MGSVGWGIASLLTGVVFHFIDLKFCWTIAFITGIPFALISLFNLHPLLQHEEDKIDQSGDRMGVLEAIQTARITWLDVMFFIVCFFFGAAMVFMEGYLFIWLERLGGGALMIGLS